MNVTALGNDIGSYSQNLNQNGLGVKVDTFVVHGGFNFALRNNNSLWLNVNLGFPFMDDLANDFKLVGW